MELDTPPITLRQLQYVLAVDEARSFSRAAARCHVSQPSLSAQIAQLEDALGVRLFERDRRRVIRTPAGDRIALHARRVLVAAKELVQAADAARDPWSATWRLGVIPTISPYLLPDIAPALREAHPTLKVIWTEATTSSLVADLHAGRLDAAVVALEADLAGLESVALASDEFVLAMPADHRLARATSRGVSPSVLEEVDVLLLDDGHCLREQALAVCGRPSPADLEFRATSLTTLTEMVAGGAGVTLLPSIAIPTETRDGRIAVRRFTKPAPHRTLGLVWRPESPLEPALREAGKTMATAVRARN